MTSMCPIGFGTWLIKPNDAKDTILQAFDAGYTHFDLAWFYKNEKQIADAFKIQFEEKKADRSKYFITTKVWNTNHEPSKLKKQVDEQLNYINLKYFDLIVIHWPIHEKYPGDGVINKGFTSDFDKGYGMRDVWIAMEQLVQEGKCKHVGLSNFPVASILDILSYCKIKPFCNQVEVNILFQNTKLINWCLKQGIKVVAYKPIGGQDTIASLSKLEKIQEIAKKYNQSEANIMLRWHKQKYPTDDYAIIPKTSNPDRMRMNLQIITNSPFQLTKEEIDILNGLDLGRAGRSCKNDFIPIFD